MMRLISVCLVIFIIIGGCSYLPDSMQRVGSSNHIVLLWLKDHGNQHHRQQIINATHRLEKIPGVITIRVGEAIPSSREIVDDSFDIGIHMLFRDNAAMNTYISDPDHTEIVRREVMPLIDKIIIYDFEE